MMLEISNGNENKEVPPKYIKSYAVGINHCGGLSFTFKTIEKHFEIADLHQLILLPPPTSVMIKL